jgi:hypothetical protein
LSSAVFEIIHTGLTNSAAPNAYISSRIENGAICPNSLFRWNRIGGAECGAPN